MEAHQRSLPTYKRYKTNKFLGTSYRNFVAKPHEGEHLRRFLQSAQEILPSRHPTPQLQIDQPLFPSWSGNDPDRANDKIIPRQEEEDTSHNDSQSMAVDSQLHTTGDHSDLETGALAGPSVTSMSISRDSSPEMGKSLHVSL